jgi:biopolymer transport protein ExbB/TolQ
MLLGIANVKLGLARIRRLLAENFEREVISELEYQIAWINTIIKTAPMLGLLGTVQGMIQAFGKIAAVSKETGTDPQMLANDISFALLTTAYGLMIAIPLVMFMAAIQVRIAKLQDNVQEGIGEFLEQLEASGKIS